MFVDSKLQRLMRLYWSFAIVATVLVSAMALARAQGADAPAGDVPISGGADLALTLYAMIAGLLATGLGWLGKQVSAWLAARTKNETIAGAIARFSDSVFAAVKTVNQTLKAEIEKAKDPKSPGGAAITKEEAAKLKSAVWDALKAEYGGLAGIGKFLGVLGLGDQGAVETWVNNRIEAAVHDTKPAAPLR